MFPRSNLDIDNKNTKNYSIILSYISLLVLVFIYVHTLLCRKQITQNSTKISHSAPFSHLSIKIDKWVSINIPHHFGAFYLQNRT